ncbi:hypothetical protein [Hydrogenophaga sp. MI9]|uniref:hypothetical protein n=1 Tax=Hydrogenophaga sp. MI9 TaxID=3453719 RepID=UPI003EECABFE
MRADDMAGSLRVRPGVPVPGALHSERRDWASRLAQGQAATALPGLLASLFSLCSHAHRLCAQLAVSAAAPGAVAAPTDVARRLRLETAQEHVRRIGLDWPRLLAGAPVPAALASLQTSPLLRPANAAAEPDWAPSLAWFESEWLQMPAATWLRAWQACGADWLIDWSRRHTGWLPTLLRAAREADTGPALDMDHALRAHTDEAGQQGLADALAQTPGFAMQPLWHGACAHTGTWSRLHGADDGLPLTPWAMLGCRLAELARLCLPAPQERAGWLAHGALRLSDGQGLAWVEMARGLLVHRVAIDGHGATAKVRSCRVLAPTEWNFHPQGAVAQRIAALDTGVPEALLHRQLALLMVAFDPCVPFHIGAAQDQTEEVSHA